MEAKTEVEAADQSASIAALAAALAKAQSQMEAAAKDSTNPHFKSKYADLASVWAACREPLTSNGLAVVQRVSSTNGSVVLTTQLLHSSGEWIRDRCTFPVAQQTAQAYGSAITYARRYALAAMVGVAPDEDDDGHAATPQRDESPPPPRSAPRQEAAKTATAPKFSDADRMKAARANRIWHRAKAIAMTQDAFRKWVATIIGAEVASNQWDDAQMQQIEDELTQAEAEANATVDAIRSEMAPPKRMPIQDNSKTPDRPVGNPMSFGSGKGKPLASLDAKSLEWYATVLGENVTNPEKARFRDSNMKALESIRAEQERRRNDDPIAGTENPSAEEMDVPF